MKNDHISEILCAEHVGNNTLVISSKKPEKSFFFHGSTMQASTAPDPYGERCNNTTTMTFYPKKDEEGIIAVVIDKYVGHSGGKHNQAEYAKMPVFLMVTWTGEEGKRIPHIDLKNSWHPIDRIGQIREHYLEVTIKGKRFGTTDSEHYRFKGNKNNPIFVPDGNLLCRYLFGTATAAEVVHAAVQHRLEPTLRRQLDLATEAVKRAQNELNTLSYEALCRRRELETLRGEISMFRAFVNENLYSILERSAQ